MTQFEIYLASMGARHLQASERLPSFPGLYSESRLMRLDWFWQGKGSCVARTGTHGYGGPRAHAGMKEVQPSRLVLPPARCYRGLRWRKKAPVFTSKRPMVMTMPG
jgi:hypothetical protein